MVIFHSKNLHRLPGRVSLINWLNHVDHEHVDILSPAPPVLVFDLESMESVFQISTCFFFASVALVHSSNSSLANMELNHAETSGLNFSHTKVFL